VGCAKRPAPATASAPEMRKAYYYYSGRPYGSDAYHNPLTSILNNGYDQIRTGPPEGRRVFTYDYRESATAAWQSMIHPRRLVREYGVRDWFRYELLPLTLKSQGGGQWVPNYQLHTFGGGATYIRLIAWFEQRGTRYPRVAAAATSYAGHFLNEMLENGDQTRGSIDAMTDLLIFDPAIYLLWGSDRVQRFVGERVEFTEWSGQPAIAFPHETLENAFQTTLLRAPLPRTENWRAFTTMGGSYVGGLSRRRGDSTWVSLGFGWDARRNPVIDTATGRKTVELLGNVALFVDRNASLLGSVVLKSGFDAGVTLNVYPGVVRLGDWSPGFWAHVLRDPTGLRFGITSPIGVGIARNP
jgi:hypothetical protein